MPLSIPQTLLYVCLKCIIFTFQGSADQWVLNGKLKISIVYNNTVTIRKVVLQVISSSYGSLIALSSFIGCSVYITELSAIYLCIFNIVDTFNSNWYNQGHKLSCVLCYKFIAFKRVDLYYKYYAKGSHICAPKSKNRLSVSEAVFEQLKQLNHKQRTGSPYLI